jgi:hypothetical protein
MFAALNDAWDGGTTNPYTNEIELGSSEDVAACFEREAERLEQHENN